MCHHHKYDKRACQKDGIHTDGKETEAREINIITTVWPLFVLNYLGISSDMTEVLPAPQNSQCAELLRYTQL